MTEIETRKGVVARVRHGRWRVLRPRGELGKMWAELLQEYSDHHSSHCDSPAYPNSDWCRARVVVEFFGGRITKEPEFDPPVEGRIY